MAKFDLAQNAARTMWPSASWSGVFRCSALRAAVGAACVAVTYVQCTQDSLPLGQAVERQHSTGIVEGQTVYLKIDVWGVERWDGAATTRVAWADLVRVSLEPAGGGGAVGGERVVRLQGAHGEEVVVERRRSGGSACLEALPGLDRDRYDALWPAAPTDAFGVLWEGAAGSVPSPLFIVSAPSEESGARELMMVEVREDDGFQFDFLTHHGHGMLEFCIEDEGESVRSFWGGSGYSAWRSVEPAEVERLVTALGGDPLRDDPLVFVGQHLARFPEMRIEAFLETHRVRSHLDTWVTSR